MSKANNIIMSKANNIIMSEASNIIMSKANNIITHYTLQTHFLKNFAQTVLKIPKRYGKIIIR